MTILNFPKAKPSAKFILPSFMVAGVKSGCGKTTVMLSLLAALKRRGTIVQTFKAGPDFIDPTHHTAITDKASYNLDTWMGADGLMEKVFARTVSKMYAEIDDESLILKQMIMVEGVMGLFDGAILKDDIHEAAGSSAQLAQSLNLPILLVVDAKGLAQSVAAIVHGYLSYRPNLEFIGIVCTNVGSQKHALMLEIALDQFDIPLLGLFPRENVPTLPSRHLGLMMPNELDLKINDLADYAEQYFDFEQLFQSLISYYLIFETNPVDNLTLQLINEYIENPHLNNKQLNDLQKKTNTSKNTKVKKTSKLLSDKKVATHKQESKQSKNAVQSLELSNRPRIGIAKDEAFCFLYPDFPEMLNELNADVVYFSPIHDQAIPDDCQALYIPGGYPELYAQQLSSNVSMLNSINKFALNDGIIYGECGGYMYLMQKITYKGTSFKMCQCLPCSCQLQDKKEALGYRSVIPYNDDFWGTTDIEVRGHEFHYAKIIWKEGFIPLWKVKDASGEILSHQGMQLRNVAASWIHLYPESARMLFAGFIQKLNLN